MISNHHRSSTRQTGFTLIECLTALLIAAILLSVIVYTQQHSIKLYQRWQAHQHPIQPWRDAMSWLADDVAHLQNPTTLRLGDTHLTWARSAWPAARLHTNDRGIRHVTYGMDHGCLKRYATRHPHTDAWRTAGMCLMPDIHSMQLRIRDEQGHWHAHWPASGSHRPMALALQLNTTTGRHTATWPIVLGRVYPWRQQDA